MAITLNVPISDLAYKANCIPSFFSQIIAGDRSENPDLVRRISTGYNIPLEIYYILREIAMQLTSNDKYSDEKKYQIMLLKALGEIYPNLKKDVDKTLNRYFGDLHLTNDTYTSKQQESEISENTFTPPYPVGTPLYRITNDTIHIDKVLDYTKSGDEIFAILALDVLIDPKCSVPIKIEDLLKNWHVLSDSIKVNKKRKH